ncbi:MAG TPA: Gldg family protein, partial [Candidatus Krumholzibacterium sp.]|nr:Gldg family protein [Candidatus Krumholzibacterium sp.]
GLSSLAEALRMENYEVADLLLLGNDRIPEDCTLLVIAGPDEDIVKPEQNIIFDYLVHGGKVLLLIDPIKKVPMVRSIANAFGIVPAEDIVIDPNGNRLAGNYLTPVVNQYGRHPITEDFKLFSFFPQARSISVAPRLPDAVTVTVLGKTGESAYGETSTDTLVLTGKTQYEAPQDSKGPVSIAAAAEMEIVIPPADSGSAGTPGTSRIVVFGDSDFTGNANFRLSGNRDLVLNSVNWLAEEEDLISIRPSEVLNQPVLLSSEQGRVVFWLPVIGLPALFALAGVLINIRNRRSP